MSLVLVHFRFLLYALNCSVPPTLRAYLDTVPSYATLCDFHNLMVPDSHQKYLTILSKSANLRICRASEDQKRAKCKKKPVETFVMLNARSQLVKNKECLLLSGVSNESF